MSSIDVVIPCYRYGRFLRQCVESVLTQPVRDLRVLIIDDASPDNTQEVAAELALADPRVTIWRHIKNIGHIATYNEGIEWSSADYMLILSADDYLLSGSLCRAAQLMDRHPEVGFTFGRAREIRTNSDPPSHDEAPGPLHGRILTGVDFIKMLVKSNIVSTPTALVRTALQKRLGGYRPDLPHSGDMEMWLRFAAHSSVGQLYSYQAVYRRHGGNMSLAYTSDSWLPDLEQRKAALDCFFDTCANTLPTTARLRRELYRSFACCTLDFASWAFNDHDTASAERLFRYALKVCPGAILSWPSLKLAIKRLFGQERWRVVRQFLIRFLRRPLMRAGI